jgi:hypothetical protein
MIALYVVPFYALLEKVSQWQENVSIVNYFIIGKYKQFDIIQRGYPNTHCNGFRIS